MYTLFCIMRMRFPESRNFSLPPPPCPMKLNSLLQPYMYVYKSWGSYVLYIYTRNNIRYDNIHCTHSAEELDFFFFYSFHECFLKLLFLPPNHPTLIIPICGPRLPVRHTRARFTELLEWFNSCRAELMVGIFFVSSFFLPEILCAYYYYYYMFSMTCTYLHHVYILPILFSRGN